jgi:hypothetical protein
VKDRLAELARGKVATEDDAVRAAMDRRFKSGGGLDAQERMDVAGLIHAGGFQGRGGQFLWIVRSFWGVGLNDVREEVWVNAATGETRLVFPFEAAGKK